MSQVGYTTTVAPLTTYTVINNWDSPPGMSVPITTAGVYIATLTFYNVNILASISTANNLASEKEYIYNNNTNSVFIIQTFKISNSTTTIYAIFRKNITAVTFQGNDSFPQAAPNLTVTRIA
jgi:hypothetical protein